MQVVRLPVKFAIISAAFMVPLCVAVYGVVSYAMSNIEFAEQERLVTLVATQPKQGWDRSTTSIPDLQDWREATTSFTSSSVPATRHSVKNS